MRAIIFIPGIETTALVNSNTFNFDTIGNIYDTVGNVIGNAIKGPQIEEKLQLDPLYDETITSIIERGHVARLPYQRTIEKIQSSISGAQVYIFGYDWRLSNIENGRRLKLFAEYLKRKLQPQGVTNFHFITHSMGALVFSCFLKQLGGDYSLIDKAVLCTPPFLGTPYALIHMLKGIIGFKSLINRVLGNNEDIRKVLRTYPAIFELLPFYNPESLIFEEDNTPVDLLRIEHWQSNIYDDILELFQRRLTDLSVYRANGFLPLNQLDENVRKRIVVVAGSNSETPRCLKVRKTQDWINNYVLISDATLSTGTGDGTVPLESSTPYQNEVLTFNIKKADLFGESAENIDFHGLFLTDSRVQNIIIRFLSEETNLYPILKARGPFANEWWRSIGDADSVIKIGNYNMLT